MPTEKEQWPKLREWMAGVFDELWSLFGTAESNERLSQSRDG